MNLLCLVFLACVSTPWVEDEPMQCMITGSVCKMAPEAEETRFRKACAASDICDERITRIFILKSVAPKIVETRI